MTMGPHRQGAYPTDKRLAVAQLDKLRQNTPFLSLAQSYSQPPLATSGVPLTLSPHLNLRPSERSK